MLRFSSVLPESMLSLAPSSFWPSQLDAMLRFDVHCSLRFGGRRPSRVDVILHFDVVFSSAAVRQPCRVDAMLRFGAVVVPMTAAEYV